MNVRWLLLAIACILLGLILAGGTVLSAQEQPGWEDGTVDEILSSLTPREKVAQLLIVGFWGPEADAEVRQYIAEYGIGGVYLSREACNVINGPAHDPAHCEFSAEGDIDTPAQVASLTQGLQEASCAATKRSAGGQEYCLPLFISVDHEGDGRPLARLVNGFTPVPSNMAIGATFDPQHAESVGCIVGGELAAVGVNMLLGPGLDVLDSPRSGGPGDQGIRSFGGDPLWVAEMAESYVRGLHECGWGRIAAVVKHFPGHGRSTRGVDYEDIPVVVGKTSEELARVDLAPFRAVAQGNPGDLAVADAMMNSHLSYPEVAGCDSETPVTFSSTCMQSFVGLPEFAAWRANGGLTVADDLAAGAVLAYARRKFGDYLQGNVVEEALLAGNDVLPLIRPWQYQDLQPTMDYLVSRYEADAQVRERVDDAVRRVLSLKLRLNSGLDPAAVTAEPEAPAGINGEQASEAVSSLAAKALTFIRPNSLEEFRRAIPAPSVGQRILFVECWDDPTCMPPGPDDASQYPPLWPNGKLASLAVELFPGRVSTDNVRTMTFSQLGSVLRGNGGDKLKAAVDEADWIVIAFLERDPARFPDSEVLKDFLGRGPSVFDLRSKKVVVFAYGSPYHLDAGELRNADLFIALYSKTEPMLRASLKALFHDATILRDAGTGRLPVDYRYGDYVLYDLSEQVQPDPSQAIELTTDPDPPSPGEEYTIALASPLLARNGHRAPDGTTVRFAFTLSDGSTEEVSVTTVDGMAEARLNLPATGGLSVTISAGDLEWSGTVGTILDLPAGPDGSAADTTEAGEEGDGVPVTVIASVTAVAAAAAAVVAYTLYRRRRRTPSPAPARQATAGDEGDSLSVASAESELQVDSATHRVFVRGTEIQPPLSREQFELLAYMYEAPGNLCTRQAIIERVWPEVDAAGVSDQAVDSLVHRIRERLRSAGASKPFIVTVRGQGFRLDL